MLTQIPSVLHSWRWISSYLSTLVVACNEKVILDGFIKVLQSDGMGMSPLRMY